MDKLELCRDSPVLPAALICGFHIRVIHPITAIKVCVVFK